MANTRLNRFLEWVHTAAKVATAILIILMALLGLSRVLEAIEAIFDSNADHACALVGCACVLELITDAPSAEG
jgi:hypothetical protein